MRALRAHDRLVLVLVQDNQSLEMEVIVSKVVVLLLLGLIKLACGLAPLLLARNIKRSKRSNDYWVKKFIGECYLLSEVEG